MHFTDTYAHARTHVPHRHVRIRTHAHVGLSHAQEGRLAPHLFDQLRKLCHRHFHQIFSCSGPASTPRRPRPRPCSSCCGIVSGTHLIFGATASSPVPRPPSCPSNPAHACSRLALEKGGTRHAVLGRARPDKFRNLVPSAGSAPEIGARSVPSASRSPLMCASHLRQWASLALYRTVLRMRQGERGRQKSRQRDRQRSGRGTGMSNDRPVHGAAGQLGHRFDQLRLPYGKCLASISDAVTLRRLAPPGHSLLRSREHMRTTPRPSPTQARQGGRGQGLRS